MVGRQGERLGAAQPADRTHSTAADVDADRPAAGREPWIDPWTADAAATHSGLHPDRGAGAVADALAQAVERCLDAAGLSPGLLRDVVLTGASSQVSAVQAAVAAASGLDRAVLRRTGPQPADGPR